MAENSLKSLLSISYIVFHLVIIFLVVFFRFTERYDEATVKSALSVLAPIFTAYITPMMIYIVNRRHKTDPGRKVNPSYVFLALLPAYLSLLFLLTVIIKQAIVPDAIDNFIVYLGWGELLFGPYLIYIFGNLFKTTHPPA